MGRKGNGPCFLLCPSPLLCSPLKPGLREGRDCLQSIQLPPPVGSKLISFPGGGCPKKLYTRMLRSKTQTLTPLRVYTRKGNPFIYSLTDILKGPFENLNDSFLYPFLHFSSSNPYSFIYLHPEKGTLSGGASPYSLL